MGWHWFAKPYRFQVYNSIKHHLHTASCTHCPKQSVFQFPFSFPLHIFWLIPATSFIQSPSRLPLDSCHYVPCIHVSLSILFNSLFFFIMLCVIYASIGSNWKVSIITSDLPNAGTSSQVYIILYGQHRSSAPIYLYGTDGARFQNGQEDVFNVSNKIK